MQSHHALSPGNGNTPTPHTLPVTLIARNTLQHIHAVPPMQVWSTVLPLEGKNEFNIAGFNSKIRMEGDYRVVVEAKDDQGYMLAGSVST